ncbi:MAG: hypothetical protein K8S99_08565 [Planctomycetes bacterium]|nr:hypothetical protein [Planctomycetota bacterium]
MKIKNLNFVDKHIHKIILGVSLLFLALVVFLYVLGSPYKATLSGTKEAITPPDVIDAYNRAGDKLKVNINRTESLLPSMNIPSYTENFQTHTLRSPVGRPRFEVPFGMPGVDPHILPDIQPNQAIAYQIDTPPYPHDYAVSTGFNVLAPRPDQPQLNEAMLKLIGNKQPRDFHYVSVGAFFDFDAWRNKLRSAPTEARIPEDWWRNYLLITYLRLERQTLNPATEKWGPVEVIAALPGQPDYSAVSENLTPDDAIRTVNAIRQSQSAIATPQFVPTSGEQPWAPPLSEAALSEPAKRQVTALQQKINDVVARIQALESAGTSGRRPPTPAPAPPSGTGRTHPGMPPGAGQPPPAGAGFGSLDGSAASRDNPAAPPPASTPAEPAAAPTGNPQIDALRAELLKYRVELNRVNAAGNNFEGGAGGAQNRVPIWAHDITVQPGKTYRYRIRPAVFNPLFQKREPAPEQRLKQMNKLSWVAEFPESDDTVWSKRVTIETDTRFFVVKANRPVGVTVKVFRIFGGAWQWRDFNVAAGDSIGGQQVLKSGNDQATVDMSVGALVVDVIFPTSSGSVGAATSSTRMLYLDTASNEMRSRSVEVDKENPQLKEMGGP